MGLSPGRKSQMNQGKEASREWAGGLEGIGGMVKDDPTKRWMGYESGVT